MSRRVFDFDRAIVRFPAPSVVSGLSLGLAGAPSFDGVLAEHCAYVAALKQAGLEVETLPWLDEFPDSLFVEDAAFVIPEGAVILRPGAPSRIDEADAIAPALRRRFETVLAVEAGFVDGGDILILPDEILVGLSARTDRAGAEQFVAHAAELGRPARIVPTPLDALHLKSACALLDEETVIATPTLAAAGIFGRLDVVATPGWEVAAANLLRINDVVLVGAGFPRTISLLADRGFDTVPLPVAEIGRIDAGLSCMSLRWRAEFPSLGTGRG